MEVTRRGTEIEQDTFMQNKSHYLLTNVKAMAFFTINAGGYAR
jgi:hypothetical protein